MAGSLARSRARDTPKIAKSGFFSLPPRRVAGGGLADGIASLVPHARLYTREHVEIVVAPHSEVHGPLYGRGAGRTRLLQRLPDLYDDERRDSRDRARVGLASVIVHQANRLARRS
jgi:hypothetical protein